MSVNEALAISHQLDRLENTLIGFADALCAEYTMSLEYLDHFTDTGDLLQEIGEDLIRVDSQWLIPLLPHCESIDRVRKNISAVFAYSQAQYRTGDPVVIQKWQDDAKQMVGQNRKSIWRNHDPVTLLIVSAIMPSLDGVYPEYLRTKTTVQLLRMALHIQYPNMISPGIDPFDGNPIRTRHNPDGALVLWSIGPDLVDDGSPKAAKEEHDFRHEVSEDLKDYWIIIPTR